MKLFLTSSLLILLLLVPLALSNVITKRSDEKKFKIIYDKGFYYSELLDQSLFGVKASPDRNIDGERNGDDIIKLQIATGKDYNLIGVNLAHNSEVPSLDHLSFVMESLSEDTEECEVASTFKSVIEHCEGPIRVREMTGEEKSMAQKRRKHLAASLEAKKYELGGTKKSDESGEFRLLIDNVSNRVIAEAIGFHSFSYSKEMLRYGINIEASSWEGDSDGRKKLSLKDEEASFAVENILEANDRKDCEHSPMKDWIRYCSFAELRPLTDVEKSQLDELKGSI